LERRVKNRPSKSVDFVHEEVFQEEELAVLLEKPEASILVFVLVEFSGIPSTPPQNIEKETIEPTVEEYRNQESIYNETIGKGKEKERSKKDSEETVFATGSQLREPVINSPADIYRHFP